MSVDLEPQSYLSYTENESTVDPSVLVLRSPDNGSLGRLKPKRSLFPNGIVTSKPTVPFGCLDERFRYDEKLLLDEPI